MVDNCILKALESHNDVAKKIIEERNCKAKEDIKNFLLAIISKFPEDEKLSLTIEGLLTADRITVAGLRCLETGESIQFETKVDAFWLEKYMVDELGARSDDHIAWYFG